MDDITLFIVFLAFMNVLLFMSGMLSGSIVLVSLAILGIPGVIGMIIDGRENKRIERHKNTLRNIAAMEDDIMPDALTHWDEEATEAYRLEVKEANVATEAYCLEVNEAKVADLNCPSCNHYVYDGKGYCVKCNHRWLFHKDDNHKVIKKATQSALDAAEAKYVANHTIGAKDKVVVSAELKRAYINREHFDH